MWRRTYIFLVLVRLWFALSPSYLHPDENFQGPEVIAGMSDFADFFSFAVRLGMTLRAARLQLGLPLQRHADGSSEARCASLARRELNRVLMEAYSASRAFTEQEPSANVSNS